MVYFLPNTVVLLALLRATYIVIGLATLTHTHTLYIETLYNSNNK